MTSSPSLHTAAAGSAASANSPAFFAAPQAPGGAAAGTPSNNAAASPSTALLASLTAAAGNSSIQGMTPSAASPSGLFLGRQQSLPSPATSVQYPGTPSAQHALLAQALRQQQQQTHQQGGSVAGGSAITHSAVGVTSADAPNEARRLVRTLLDDQGQGRLSLVRIANEVTALVQDVNNAFTTVPALSPAARLADLLACLDELQVQLARTGLGALPITGENVDYGNIQATLANMSQEVQAKFKHRQRVREGAGVVKSVLK